MGIEQRMKIDMKVYCLLQAHEFYKHKDYLSEHSMQDVSKPKVWDDWLANYSSLFRNNYMANQDRIESAVHELWQKGGTLDENFVRPLLGDWLEKEESKYNFKNS